MLRVSLREKLAGRIKDAGLVLFGIKRATKPLDHRFDDGYPDSYDDSAETIESDEVRSWYQRWGACCFSEVGHDIDLGQIPPEMASAMALAFEAGWDAHVMSTTCETCGATLDADNRHTGDGVFGPDNKGSTYCNDPKQDAIDRARFN